MQSELGEVLREFKANTEHLNRYVGFGFWMALTGLGSVYLGGRGAIETNIADQTYFELTGNILLLAAGLAILCFGLFVWNSHRSLYSQKVRYCTDGLIVDVQEEVHVFPWGKIESVEAWRSKKGDTIYVVWRVDGNAISINNTLKSYEQLAGLIKEEAVLRSIPWVLEREN